MPRIFTRKRAFHAAWISILLLALAGTLAWRHLNRRGGPTGPTGLKVILTARQDEFKLGEPMRFRAIVQNMSLRGVQRDFQDLYHLRFEIIGPDGEAVTEVGRDFSTLGEGETLPPFHYKVAYDDDLLADYLITKEGEYSIRAKSIAKDIPESNTIKFVVKGGEVTEVDRSVQAILQVLPPGWSLYRSGCRFEVQSIPGAEEADGAWIYLSWHGRRVRILLLMTRTPISIPPGATLGKRRAVCLGAGEPCRYHLFLPEGAVSQWPALLEDLKRALRIE